jgi:hypothetical protein
MSQAVANSGLSEAQISSQNTGLIVGSGSASNDNVIDAYETLKMMCDFLMKIKRHLCHCQCY